MILQSASNYWSILSPHCLWEKTHLRRKKKSCLKITNLQSGRSSKQMSLGSGSPASLQLPCNRTHSFSFNSPVARHWLLFHPNTFSALCPHWPAQGCKPGSQTHSRCGNKGRLWRRLHLSLMWPKYIFSSLLLFWLGVVTHVRCSFIRGNIDRKRNKGGMHVVKIGQQRMRGAAIAALHWFIPM